MARKSFVIAEAIIGKGELGENNPPKIELRKLVVTKDSVLERRFSRPDNLDSHGKSGVILGGYDSLIGLDEAIGRYGAENIIRGMFNYLSDYISDAEDREDIFDKLKELIKTIDGVPTVLPPVMTSIPKPIVPESIKKPKEKNTGKE